MRGLEEQVLFQKAADVEAERTTWWQRAGNRHADEAAKEGARLALPDDQLDLAFGLDLIARQMMIYTGRLQAHIGDHKLLDHASDIILEIPPIEDEDDEPEAEASGGLGAAAPSAAAGAALAALALRAAVDM